MHWSFVACQGLMCVPPHRMCRVSLGWLAGIIQATSLTCTVPRKSVLYRTTLDIQRRFQGCRKNFGKRRFPWKDIQPFVVENCHERPFCYAGICASSANRGFRKPGVAQIQPHPQERPDLSGASTYRPPHRVRPDSAWSRNYPSRPHARRVLEARTYLS